MPAFDISIAGRIAEYQAELAKIPGYTQKMAAAAATKLALESERGNERAAEAAKKAAEQAGRSWARAGDAANESTEKLSGGLNSLSDLARGLGLGPLEDAADGLRAVVEGGAGLGMVSAAATAAAAAFVGLGVGIVKAVQAADELVEETQALRDMGALRLLDPEDVRAIQEANAAMKAIGTVMDDIVIGVAAEFAPAVRDASIAITAMGLSVVDTATAMGGFGALLEKIAVEVIQRFLVKNMLLWLDLSYEAIALTGKLARMLGMEGLAGELEAVKIRWDEWTESISERIVEGALGSFSASMGDLKVSFGDTWKRAEGLVGASLRLGKKGDAGEAVDEMVEALERLGNVYKDKATASVNATQIELENIALVKEEAKAADAEMRASAEELAKTRQQAALSAAKAGLQATEDLILAYADQMDETGRMSYVAQKAISLANIAISTAEMAVEWGATLGPPGVVAALAIGATQAATAAAVPPPSFHVGGTLYPDEATISAKVQAGETVNVQSAQAVRASQHTPALRIVNAYSTRIQSAGYRDASLTESRMRQDARRAISYRSTTTP